MCTETFITSKHSDFNVQSGQVIQLGQLISILEGFASIENDLFLYWESLTLCDQVLTENKTQHQISKHKTDHYI